ncbi:MAG: hypothetical protein IOD12_02300, partial [Silvanigrellales bacterium]|nr:hypothetical protein [Silvanigrellales bacterium]
MNETLAPKGVLPADRAGNVRVVYVGNPDVTHALLLEFQHAGARRVA